LRFASAEGPLRALRRLEQANPRGWRDLIPGARSLLVETGETALDEALLRDLEVECDRVDGNALPAGASHVLEVSYDGADLAAVAAHSGLSVAEVVALHTGAEYRVGFVGF